MHVIGNASRRRASATDQPKRESEVQVQYTPAKPFNRNRFLLHLATVAAVVLALVLGMSIFFKTGQVLVSGAEKYTPWEIKEASGIQGGDALLNLNEAKIVAQIRAKLPYVGDARVGIKLPNTVIIEIKELEVVYAVEDNNAAWWLMDAEGRVVDSTDSAAAKNYTRIIGVKIKDAEIGQQAVAAEIEVPESTETGFDIPALPSTPAAQLLDGAVQVLAALEQNGVMGCIDSVDVSDISQIVLWYENRYHITLGNTNRLEYKVGAMKAAIQKMGQYQSGYVDASFVIWPDSVGYRPFDEGS